MHRDNIINVVIPALNEEEAVGKVVSDLKALKNENEAPLIDHVIVCDNGSTDATADVAEKAGAEVVYQSQAGYGIACLTAIDAIKSCDIVLFVDADDSCVVSQCKAMFEHIVDGADIVIGSRTLGKAEKGALTRLQVFGNGLSSVLIKALWQHPITDLGPFRAIKRTALAKLDMQDKSFGWTVEMQVKAIQLGLITQEIAVDSKVRIGQSKISGTLKGSVNAGIGIISMIARLRFNQRKFVKVQQAKFEHS